ncbi:heparan-alpha-glucosaminide N-acetyltransferase domain-containing protein [Pelobium sp.]|nr:heparan-alpha-glucosaminide N-acetyltransferase domain-containing protein [Pelobium sp.]MDA9554694.1 heparan-alpha-glucosaminide N-acetyltransferase domain-containing protein [Pelobium sp.]
MAKTSELKPRLLSLDVFRGITVAAMILVNNPGDWGHIYAPLEHAEWNGCTPTDLIFPFFLFIVGVAIVYALGTKKASKENHAQIIKSILKRSAILFGLGLLLSLFPFFDFSTVRILGVLQRIAIVYFFSALIFIKLPPKAIGALLVVILLSYWAMMTLIPVPDVGFANLEKETNLGAWLDRLILTENHTWKLSKTWDPEGILSTLPAIGSGLFGVLIGGVLKGNQLNDHKKTIRILGIGSFAVIIGLCWNIVFPLNKSLWTSSYVLYAGGLAAIGLALCYWIIDVKGFKKYTTPFVIYGVNAITVFFASGIIARSMNLIKVHLNGKEISLKGWFYESFYTPYFSSPYNASVAGAITFVFIWWVILWLMYRKNIIIKV